MLLPANAFKSNPAMGARIDHLGLCRDLQLRLIPRLTPAHERKR